MSVAQASASPFESRYSVIKLMGWALLAAPLVAGSAWMLSRAMGQGNTGAGLIGVLGLAFFGSAMLGFLARAADRRVQLRIDAEGFYLRPHSDRTIPLRSIRKVELATGMVRAFLHKPSKYPVEGRFRRFIYRLNGASARNYFGDAWVWTAHYDCTWEDILSAMNTHRVPTDFERELAARSESAQR